MKLTCPHCSAEGNIPDDKIPDHPVKLRCPHCRESFTFTPEPVVDMESVPEPEPVVPAVGGESTPQTTPSAAASLSQPPVLSVSGYILAVLLGILSGTLLSIEFDMLLKLEDGLLSNMAFILLTAGSMYILIRGSRSPAVVLMKGFLMGAVVWFAMLPVGSISAGRVAKEAIGRSAADKDLLGAGAGLAGGGLFALVSWAIALIMAVLCLIGFAITFFVCRERTRE